MNKIVKSIVPLVPFIIGLSSAATTKDIVVLVQKAGYVHQDCYEFIKLDGVHCGQFDSDFKPAQANFSKAATSLKWKQIEKWHNVNGSESQSSAKFKNGSDVISITLNAMKQYIGRNYFKIDWVE